MAKGSKIKLLDDELINKIAAGEVIERPASVVKELVENSIDAGADEISVEIKAGGQELIKVTDNGSGMSKEDALLSLERHATSKISNDKDLFSISSLGFRGEALASIAAVSRLTLITRQKDENKGFMLRAEASKIIEQKIVGCKEGTEVIVENLFYNTPARKKHLYSITSEFSNIINIVQRYALIYDNVGFKLMNNGKLVFNSPKNEKGVANIINIYGINTAKAMLPVNFEDDLFKVSGYISKPSLTRATKDHQSFYINKRFVKNKTVSQALYDAYHTLLFLDRNPVAILDVEIDFSMVDVNVHPTKDVVRIDQENKLYDFIFEAVRETLQSNNLIPVADVESSFSYRVEALLPKKSRYSIRPDTQSLLDVKSYAKEEQEEEDIHNKPEEHKQYEPDALEIQPQQEKLRIRGLSEVKGEEKTGILSPYRLLGQLDLTYILLETAHGLVVIDQHAAQERVNYEKFMKQYKDSGLNKQRLVEPKILEFTLKDKSVLLNNLELLDKLGFELEEYGKNNFLLRSIPNIFGRYYDNLIYDVIGELGVNRKEVDNIKEERIIRMACRKSIKAGDEMTSELIKALIADLELAEKPYTCPHGRPTIITMSIQQLEKLFKRVG